MRRADEETTSIHVLAVQPAQTVVLQFDYATFSAEDAAVGLGAYSVSWVLDIAE